MLSGVVFNTVKPPEVGHCQVCYRCILCCIFALYIKLPILPLNDLVCEFLLGFLLMPYCQSNEQQETRVNFKHHYLLTHVLLIEHDVRDLCCLIAFLRVSLICDLRA